MRAGCAHPRQVCPFCVHNVLALLVRLYLPQMVFHFPNLVWTKSYFLASSGLSDLFFLPAGDATET